MFHLNNRSGLDPAFSPAVMLSVCFQDRGKQPTAYLLVQASQHLWLVETDGERGSSLTLVIPPQPSAPSALMLAEDTSASRHRHGPKARLHCPGSFTPDRYQSRMCR